MKYSAYSELLEMFKQKQQHEFPTPDSSYSGKDKMTNTPKVAERTKEDFDELFDQLEHTSCEDKFCALSRIGDLAVKISEKPINFEAVQKGFDNLTKLVNSTCVSPTEVANTTAEAVVLLLAWTKMNGCHIGLAVEDNLYDRFAEEETEWFNKNIR